MFKYNYYQYLTQWVVEQIVRFCVASGMGGKYLVYPWYISLQLHVADLFIMFELCIIENLESPLLSCFS